METVKRDNLYHEAHEGHEVLRKFHSIHPKTSCFL
jgi:hypothetical protein